MTLRENCFQNQFWTSGSAPTGKYMKVKVQDLRSGTSQSPKSISRSVFSLSHIYLLLKKEIGPFWSIFKKLKKCISHCIFKK